MKNVSHAVLATFGFYHLVADFLQRRGIPKRKVLLAPGGKSMAQRWWGLPRNRFFSSVLGVLGLQRVGKADLVQNSPLLRGEALGSQIALNAKDEHNSRQLLQCMAHRKQGVGRAAERWRGLLGGLESFGLPSSSGG